MATFMPKRPWWIPPPSTCGGWRRRSAFQKVYAPFDGVITARNIDIGALINAGGNAPGKELFDIAATSQLRVYVNVPQAYSRDVRPGRAAELTLAEFPGRRFAGKIVRTADSIDPASRTLLDGSGRRQSGGRIAARRFSLGAPQAEFRRRPRWWSRSMP